MARDTPGRDAYQARARRARVGSLRDYQLPKQGTSFLSSARSAISSVAKGAATSLASQALQGQRPSSGQSWSPATRGTVGKVARSPALRGVSEAARNYFEFAVGPETGKMVLGKKYSPLLLGLEGAMVSVPMRGAGRAVAPAGKRGWARYVKGKIEYGGSRPARRLPTADPEWEITRAIEDEPHVTLMGGLAGTYDRPDATNWQLDRYMRSVNRLMWSRNQADGANARDVFRQQQQMMDSWKQPATFNVVRAGTTEPHASMSLGLGRDETYVGTAANLREIQRGTHGLGVQVRDEVWVPGVHEGAEIPGAVMRQLMANAFAPGKKIHTTMINPKLAYITALAARREGIPLEDEGAYAHLINDPDPKKALREEIEWKAEAYQRRVEQERQRAARDPIPPEIMARAGQPLSNQELEEASAALGLTPMVYDDYWRRANREANTTRPTSPAAQPSIPTSWGLRTTEQSDIRHRRQEQARQARRQLLNRALQEATEEVAAGNDLNQRLRTQGQRMAEDEHRQWMQALERMTEILQRMNMEDV